MKLQISRKAGEELAYKLGVVRETEDLRRSYGYTDDEITRFESRVYAALKGKQRFTLEVDLRDLRCIAGEMKNAAEIAEDNGETSNYRSFNRLAEKTTQMGTSVTCHGIEMKRLPLPKFLCFKTSQWEDRNPRDYDLRASKFCGDADNIYVKDGVLYWKSNDHVVPVCVLRDDACLEPTPEQVAAYEAETKKFLAEYRANPPELTAEDMYEMRAAFGPGVKVVDVITGKSVTT